MSAVGLDEEKLRWCIYEQEKRSRGEDQAGLYLDSTQRPLRRAFLITPVLRVVLIGII
jgi:hypothetical protein